MARRVGVVIVLVLLLVAAGLVLVGIQRSRSSAANLACLNNFRQLGQFAALFSQPPPGRPRGEVPQVIPPGTVANPALPPEQRLSWAADMLQFFDPKYQDVKPLAARLDRGGVWDAPANREVAATRLVLLTCPGDIPAVPDGEPMPTQYIGLAGVGADGATLWLGPPVPPRAGCFRYDAPTPLQAIQDHDGLSQTLLFGEVSADLGPWLRGGPGTVRGLDDGAAARPPLGTGGQFGGNHAGVTGFGLADGSARFFTDATDPRIIRAMLTIAGGNESVGD